MARSGNTKSLLAASQPPIFLPTGSEPLSLIRLSWNQFVGRTFAAFEVEVTRGSYKVLPCDFLFLALLCNFGDLSSLTRS